MANPSLHKDSKLSELQSTINGCFYPSSHHFPILRPPSPPYFTHSNNQLLLWLCPTHHKGCQDPPVRDYHQDKTPLVSVNLVIDIGARYSWVDCDKGYESSSIHPVPCNSDRCELFKGSGCSSCSLPACGKKLWCGGFADDGKSLMVTALSQDVIGLRSTSDDGSKLGPLAFINQFPVSCGSKTILKGLASEANGILALSRSYTSLPQQLLLSSKPGSYGNSFSLCMPTSTTTKGGIFFGTGPYIEPTAHFDPSQIFYYSQLLTNPVSTGMVATTGDVSDEYFIPVRSISIDAIPISFKKSLLFFDDNGVGGTKISTMVPYTTLHSSIYKALINAYVEKAKMVGIKRVASVKPFEACFSTRRINEGGAGLIVPTIEFDMRNSNLTWRFFEPNSMVRVKKDVICLGFLDGGANPRTSIVIGGHQLGDTILNFDLISMKFGCTSTLRFFNISCADFISN